MRATRWVGAHPGLALSLLAPFAVMVVPQIHGLTFLDGDNLIQNFPMRVLTGTDLAHGHLPLWNPYLFGGTPLLAGFNGGSAYPVTWLTAVLPVFTAWSLTVVLAYDVAVLGMYAFLRRQPLTVTAATFGAATFAFAGYMTGQLVHIDLIEGTAWLPWMLVAVHGLTGRTVPAPGETPAGGTRHDIERGIGRGIGGGVRHRWAVLLAVSLGMSLLAGGAEAIIDSGVLVGIYLLGRLGAMGLWHRTRRRALGASLAGVVAGVAGGVALGAAQWAPGLAFLSQSQRAGTSYAYFTSGSLDNRLVSLLVSPFVLGTNHQGFPGGYVGTFNFAEVTSYMGILALIGACSLPLRRYRSRPEARHWWIWYVVLAVGLLSALGNQTPFGRLMYLVPGVKSERLLNRNLLLVDMALAVLAAWWVHVLLAGQDPAVPARPPGPRVRWGDIAGSRAERVVTCLPVAVMAALAVFLWVDGPLLGRLLETQYSMSGPARYRVAAVVSAQVVLAGGATWLVLSRARFRRRSLARGLGVVLVADLVLFNIFVIAPPITEQRAQAAGPTSAQFRALVGDGRFLIYDPDQFETAQLYALGQTDLNIYTRLPSGQGYTALTDGTFYQFTGSHYQEDLNPESLSGSTWDGLNVTTLLTLPGYFVTPVPAPTGSTGTTQPASSTIPFPVNLGSYRSTPDPEPTSFALAPGQSRHWFFGADLTVDSWEIPVKRGTADNLRLGLVGVTGGIQWLSPAESSVVGSGTGRSIRVTLPAPVRAGGIVVQSGPSATTVGIPQAHTAEAGQVSLDGRMQTGVASPHWAFTGMFGAFGIFRNTQAHGWAWVRGEQGGDAPAGSTAAVGATGDNGDQTITVRTTAAAFLERSASWSPGWKATVQTITSSPQGRVVGAAHPVSVTRNGVLQQVALPGAGEYLVDFRYAPPAALDGLVVSGAAAVGLTAWAVVEGAGILRRRRRRAEVSRG